MLHPCEMTAQEAQDCIADMVRRIVEDFDPLRIILFGSYARNDVSRDSDVDLLVVLPTLGNKREMAVSIRRSLAEAPLPIVVQPSRLSPQPPLTGETPAPQGARARTSW